jgi:tRNA nucleotidyltransferase (CCA-adding enzyme)
MEKHLKKLPEDILSLIYRVRDVSAAAKMPAFLVGGFVRDLLLGVRDFDLDIAVEGPGIDFAQRFCNGLECRLVTHKRFGTAAAHLANGRKLDFASARRETYPRPASLPVVSESTLKDDLFRRDFTVNTLAISLGAESFGNLLDLFKGKEDLAAGIIRVLHDRSFIDDPTRILRAVRFEQRFGFRIEPHTLRLLTDAVRQGLLLEVQPQRLRDELFLIMKEEYPERALARLRELAGFGFISPRIRWGRNFPGFFSAIRAEDAWFKASCSARRHVDLWVMYLAALCSSLKRDEALSVCRRFGFGRGETSRIIAYIAVRAKAREIISRKGVAPSALFRLLDPLPYEVILLLRAAAGTVVIKRRIAEFFRSCHGTRVFVSGHDLQRLGIAPGPEYQRILRALLDAKLDGRVTTKEDELAFINERIRNAKG